VPLRRIGVGQKRRRGKAEEGRNEGSFSGTLRRANGRAKGSKRVFRRRRGKEEKRVGDLKIRRRGGVILKEEGLEEAGFGKKRVREKNVARP